MDAGPVQQFGEGRRDIGAGDPAVELGRAEGDGARAGIVGEQGRSVVQPVQVAAAEGDAPPLLERTTDAVLAPLSYRAVFTDEPLIPAWERTLVSHLLPD